MSERISELVDKITILLIRSEERIDKTNEMVSKCVSVIDKLTNEYTRQIEKLQAVRDDMIEENKTLLNMIQKSEDKYERLLDRTLTLANANKSENNISVK